MSWAETKRTGEGRLDFRLVIAGNPHEWATSTRITHANNLDGIWSRKIFPTLSYKGLKIKERASVRDAWTNVDGITFTLESSTPSEEALISFTTDAIVVGNLATRPAPDGSDIGDIPATGTSHLLVLDNGVILPPGVYHVGTEAVLANGSNTIDRARWDTVLEKHSASTVDGITLGVPVYDRPLTLEGRRVYLYAYGESDPPDGNGVQIWVGVVASPPRMSGNGITWTINAQSVTEVFNQTIASAESIHYKIRGIYHSNAAPMLLQYRVTYEGSQYQADSSDQVFVSGFFENQTEWIAQVNFQLAQLLVNRAAGDTPTDGVAEVTRAVYDERGGPPQIMLTVGTTQSTELLSIWIQATSALDGCMVEKVSMQTSFTDGPQSLGSEIALLNDGIPILTGGILDRFGDASGAMLLTQFKESDRAPFGYPLPQFRSVLGSPRMAHSFGGAADSALSPVNSYFDASVGAAAHTADRIYLNRVDGIDPGTVLYVGNSDAMVPIEVLTIDVTTKSITAKMSAEAPGGGQVLYFDHNTTFVPLRTYVMNANVSYFLIQVVNFSENANDGDTPFIIDRDVDLLSLVAAFQQPSGIDNYWYYRNYAFLKSVSVKDVLTPELKIIGWMARLQSDGRLGFVRMPLLSATRTAAGTLTDQSVLLPADGQAGMWPTWEAQPDGLVNIAVVKLGYNPVQDDYDENKTHTIKIVNSIAAHKSSGKGSENIEVKSTASGSVSANPFLTVFDTDDAPGGTADWHKVAEWISGTYLAILSTEYAVVTVAVPFTFFDRLVGDILDVTCQLIPNGQGSRGVVSRKAYIIGREWNLDPAVNEMGKLTLYFPRTIGAGYTPTGRITSTANAGGNNWVLSFAKSNIFNIAWAEANDDVSTHFAVGDTIWVQQVGSTTPTSIAGTVTTKDNDTVPGVPSITVLLATAWTVGANTWNLKWRPDYSVATARQRTYCYVADLTRRLADGKRARNYV